MVTSSASAFPKLPEMGCGTWAWGNRLLWDYQPHMDSELQAVFNHCMEQGVTFFDTGDSYGTGKLKGQSEKLLGRFFQQYQGSQSSNLCLATKLAPYPWRLTKQSIVSAGEASASRLGQLNLVQMHWTTANYFPPQEGPLLDGLAELCQKGIAQGVGLSNYGPKRLRWAHKRLSQQGIAIRTLQVQYSLLSTYPVTQLDLKSICDELGIQLIAYSPLALGLLTGKYRKPDDLPEGFRRFALGKIVTGIHPLLDCLDRISEKLDKTPAQIAINWCICKGTLPITGAKTLEQAKQNTGALGWRLDQGQVEALDQASRDCRRQMVQNIFQSR